MEITQITEKYQFDYMLPFWKSFEAFLRVEREKSARTTVYQNMCDSLELLRFNFWLIEESYKGSLKAVFNYNQRLFNAWLNTVLYEEGETLYSYLSALLRGIDMMAFEYPKALKEIKTEYGLHPEKGECVKVSETDRFMLYKILPVDKNMEPAQTNGKKPILVIPPYVLGPNILAFLPKEQKSYVHAFANQGIPTYLRVVKDIENTPEVQVMTGEDDINDTMFFCSQLKEKYGKKVTLNGFCQGGFIALCSILSGKLDELADAVITCVAPVDGTKSGSLVEYMKNLPPRFKDLGYATKVLPNGNQVVDGDIMSWVYKLKSIERETPVAVFLNELQNFGNGGISKTAAAVNYWLVCDRRDLPENIVKMSYDSYTIPITKDGTLPVRLFGRELNLRHIEDKKIKWLLCVSEQDDLVDKEASLAPLDYLKEGTDPGTVEVTVFPKGHGAIATSWSHPDSKYALHKSFSLNNGKKYRGPVRFQLDLSLPE